MSDAITVSVASMPELPLMGGAPQPTENTAICYLARLAPTGRRSMRGALENVARLVSLTLTPETFPWASLRYAHTRWLRSALVDRYPNAASANKHLAALRGVLKEAWRLGQLSAEEYQRAVDLEPVRGSSLPAGREVDLGELSALLRACSDASTGGARDCALLALLYVGGLRRAEVAALDAAAYSAAEGSLRVLGKGNKERMVRLNDAAKAALDAWIAIRGGGAGPLVCPVRKGGRLELRRMSGTAIQHTMARRALAAGVSAFSPHDLRRSHATHALDATGDLSAVAAQLGHASVATTRRYDRRGERAQLRAVRGLVFPFRPAKQE